MLNFDVEEIADVIAYEILYDHKNGGIGNLDDRLEKDCYLAVADLKADIKCSVEKILEKEGLI